MTKIEYNGSVVATIEGGNTATLPVKDKKMKSDIKITVPEAEGEVIPEFTEVEDFAVYAESDGDGSLLVGYDVSQKVALPAGSPARLASLSDEDFIADNIRKGKNIFGLEGAYEAEEVEEYDGAIVLKNAIGTFTHQYTGGSTDTSTFEFEIGMTWAEWIESDYNTSSGTTKFTVNNDGTVGRFGGSGSARLYNGSVACVSTDVILENTTYTSAYVTGGGGSGN